MRFLFFEEKKISLLMHAAVLALLFVLPLYLMNFSVDRNNFFIKSFYLRTSIYVFIFYINYLWLVPKLLFRNKIKTFIVALLVTLSSLMILNNLGHRYLMHRAIEDYGRTHRMERFQRNDRIPGIPSKFHIYDFLVTSILVTSLSIGIMLSKKYIRNEKEKKELEKAKLDSELALLKNQVGPHFFFNTLNNIYSLVEINTGDAQKAIMNLSKLMRYLLYDTQQEKIQLKKEIEFMQNYIELMKLRLTKNVDIKVLFPSDEPEIMLPPLLFIPFIENAFKHGVSNKGKSFISITLERNKNIINFQCLNSIVSSSINLTNNHGIGLDNIRKRLSLLFPGNYTLDIDKTDREFKVLLTINCLS